MKRETIQRTLVPTGILVGFAGELAHLCSEALGSGGLRVLRVGHIAAANERIPIVMPQLVLVPTTLHEEEIEMLNDRCVAVGAEVIRVSARTAHPALVATLQAAANRALVKVLYR